jgi:thiol-disulfide isomerase/thioredoxin
VSSRRRNATRRWLHATLALAACAIAASAVAIEVNRLLPWTGGATPPLALDGLDGKRVTLDAFRGRTVIVNFWATWCVPCREEMPSLAALARRAPDTLVVLAIDVGESRARVDRFLERYPVDLPILLDTRGDAAQAWQVGVYPSSYVIGPDGRIRQYIAGALDWSDAAIVRQLQPPLVTTTR